MHPNPADSDNSNFEDANSISQNTIDDEIMDQVNVPSDNDPQYHGSYSCRFFLSPSPQLVGDTFESDDLVHILVRNEIQYF